MCLLHGPLQKVAAILAALTADVGAVAVAGTKTEGLNLSLEAPEAYYLSPAREMWFTLVVENRGSTPVYVSPVPGLLGGGVEITGRPLGRTPPAWYLAGESFPLFGHFTPYRGYVPATLFALMPGRTQRYTVSVCRQPPIPDTFDALDVRAVYDAWFIRKTRTSRTLHQRLESQPLRLPIDRSPPTAGSNSMNATATPSSTPTPRTRSKVVLSLARGVLPADMRAGLWFHVGLTNRGPDPIYISPVPGQLGGSFEIWARDVVSGRTVLLHRRAITPQGIVFEDLYALMPHEGQEYAERVCFQAPFAGEGALDVWAVYDMREMTKVNPRAFAERLESKTVRVQVKRLVPQP